ncbi:hypothetical protein GQA67_15415 [Escherichia coli]|nr:hypothetical protein [Escherichia coli]
MIRSGYCAPGKSRRFSVFTMGSLLESTAAVRIPATLAEFNRRYPKIQFSLSTGPSGTMLEGVLEGKLNAAFIDYCH